MSGKFLFYEGCMWEGGEWRIDIDVVCSSWGGGKPCKHCHSTISDANRKPQFTTWVCPRVVICYNEGGHNSTGLCLDCLLEAERVISTQEDG